jgi:alpha-L-rhamnosidase
MRCMGRSGCRVVLAWVLFSTIVAAQDVIWHGAAWIGSGAQASDPSMPVFQKSFTVDKGLSTAELRIVGLGQFEAHLNGRNVTDAILTPGWSDYRKHVLYDTYDVTQLLHQGENGLGVMLGNGMYNVIETKGRYTKFAGSVGAPKLIACLRLRYNDGREQYVVSDSSWRWHAGPIVFTSIYGGEDYDARMEEPGWDNPGFSDKNWNSAQVVTGPGGSLVPETIPPIKAFERYEPVAVTHPRADVTVYDLGQNFSGWPEITVTGERGAKVKMVAGELLDAKGDVTQRSANMYPNSENSFTYVLRGGSHEVWHPRFSYTGFRYVRVETSGVVNVDRLSGRFVHDDVRVDGNFMSSDELLNKIHRLIDRAMLSNMVSVLTDCPHREKLGWLEQTHLAGTALMDNYDLQALYAKLADDLDDAQQPDGLVPGIAPEFVVFEGGFRDSPEWGSAIVLSTWEAYQAYGDVTPLRHHYDAMQRYAAYLHGKLTNGLLEYGLGDWFDIGPGEPGESKLTSKGLTATATYYELLTDLEKIAALLGKERDAERYRAEAASLKQTFNEHFFHPDRNSYDTGSQTANAMPLVVGLVPEDRRAAVLDNVVADVRKHQNHVTAGDVGFHYLVRALTDGGRSDVLYAMLSRTDPPSYGALIAQGATALTEAWDADPNSSQNHFMLGHAEEWFYRGLAGIDVDRSRPAADQIRIHPTFPGNLQKAAASYRSSLGMIRSSWTRTGHTVQLEIEVPVRSVLQIPAGFGLSGKTGDLAIAAGAHQFTLTDLR